MQEIKDLDIEVTDIDDPPGPIEILIGPDIAAKIYTGKQIKLSIYLPALLKKVGEKLWQSLFA